jgi:hypothetical protein
MALAHIFKLGRCNDQGFATTKSYGKFEMLLPLSLKGKSQSTMATSVSQILPQEHLPLVSRQTDLERLYLLK